MQLEVNQAVAKLKESILNDLVFSFNKDSYILEFGCGSDSHVYEYHDAGYNNIFGFDIKN